MVRWLVLAIISLSWSAVAASGAPSSERQSELRYLLTQDCGSCHGLTLQGGLGPALTPSALEGKPVQLLQATILYGRTGTAMPPWRTFINEAESLWLAEKLLQGETSQ